MSRWGAMTYDDQKVFDDIFPDGVEHREIGEALVFPVRSDHVVDP